MLKKIFTTAFFMAFPLFLMAYDLPKIIDYGKFRLSAVHENKDATLGWNIGAAAFNSAPELTSLFAFLKKEYGIDTVVETGTCKGNTTILFSFLFDDVHTIEVNPEYYRHSSNVLKSFPNVRCYLGSSEKVLKSLLPQLQHKPVLFYLDAHWNEYWPLLDEIEQIGKTHRDNCIIVIDDAKVPGRNDIKYEAHGDRECSLEYIESKLKEVSSSYTVHWIIPRTKHSRAKLMIIPHHLKGN
jgi:predicted O-methyltransferase YrrM